jgi:hypothetical protein
MNDTGDHFFYRAGGGAPLLMIEMIINTELTIPARVTGTSALGWRQSFVTYLSLSPS